MDAFNKQVYLGNQFSVDTDLVTLSSTNEVPILSIANPAATSAFPTGGKSLFKCLRKLACNDVTGATGIVYRVYINPTGVTGGTQLTPINCRYASPTTSVAQVYLSPSVTTRGTLAATYSVGWENQNLATEMRIIDPGYVVLITAKATAATQGIVYINWYER